MPRKRPDLIEHLFASVQKEKARRLLDDPTDKVSVVVATMQAHQRAVYNDPSRWR